MILQNSDSALANTMLMEMRQKHSFIYITKEIEVVRAFCKMEPLNKFV